MRQEIAELNASIHNAQFHVVSASMGQVSQSDVETARDCQGRAAGLQHEDSKWVRRAGVTGRQAAEGDEDDARAERDGYDHIFVV